EPKAPDPEGHQLESGEAAGAVEGREVHEREVAAELLVTADPLVVVEEVAAPVEDRPAAVDLDRLRVVGGVAVHDVDARVIDQRVREAAVLARDLVPPVGAP